MMKKKSKGYKAGGKMKAKGYAKGGAVKADEKKSKGMAKGGKVFASSGAPIVKPTVARGSGAARKQLFRKNG
jgi:hypothetical protein